MTSDGPSGQRFYTVFFFLGTISSDPKSCAIVPTFSHGICIHYAYVALYHCNGNDSVGGLFYIRDGRTKNRKLKF
jgi:hypothetical protein